MISDSSFLRNTKLPDVIFLKNLYLVTDDTEISEIINLVDTPNLSNQERERAEMFFLKVRQQYDSWYESILGLVENFDFDLINILNNTFILDKLKAERVKNRESMEEFFT